jgi:hypothetical protein
MQRNPHHPRQLSHINSLIPKEEHHGFTPTVPTPTGDIAPGFRRATTRHGDSLRRVDYQGRERLTHVTSTFDGVVIDSEPGAVVAGS